MRTLSLQEMAKIHLHFEGLKIYYQDIREELFDHVCSRIEEKMVEGQSFDQALTESQTEINPLHFQRQILIASHLGMARNLFQDMLRPIILLKAAVVCASWILMNFLFNDLAPLDAAKHIKTLMFSVLLGIGLLSFSRDLLKNSSLVAAGNTFWLVFCFGQFALNMDLLIFLGLSAESALYTITFLLSLIYVSGLSQVTRQYKKLKTA